MHLFCELYTGGNTSTGVILYIEGGRLWIYRDYDVIFSQILGDLKLQINSESNLLRIETNSANATVLYLFSPYMRKVASGEECFEMQAKVGEGFESQRVLLQLFDDMFIYKEQVIAYKSIIHESINSNSVQLVSSNCGAVQLFFFSIEDAKCFFNHIKPLEIEELEERPVYCQIAEEVGKDEELEALVS